MDFALGLGVLVFAAPLLAIVAASIYLQDGGPILIRHVRVGRGNRPFQCLKFRTMVVDSAAALEQLLSTSETARREWKQTRKLTNDPRVTRVGRLLRSSSLDEFPQLINVLRGEMSLVGPRPVVEEELIKYGEHAPLYYSVRPGLTGAWQIGGRSDVSYERRVAMDADYVRNRSLALDVKILFMTVPAVLFSKGAR